MSRNDAKFPWRVITISTMLFGALVLIGSMFFFFDKGFYNITNLDIKISTIFNSTFISFFNFFYLFINFSQ